MIGHQFRANAEVHSRTNGRGWVLACCAATVLIVQLPGFSRHIGAAEESVSSTPTLRTLPLLFEEARNGSLLARSRAYTTGIDSEGATIAFGGRAVRLTFLGGGAAPARAEMPQRARVNYMVGPREQWRTNVPTFERVRLPHIYPGIDVVFYGNERQLEYDFELAAGVSSDTISIRIHGADELAIEDEGDLHIIVGGRTLIQHRPVAYQERDGVRVPIEARYVLANDELRFAVGPYDRQRPLVIDPVISYSTYFGATGSDAIDDVAVDTAGNALIVGYATGSDLPITSLRPKPNRASDPEPRDVYVAKLAPDGTPLWLSFYGGTSDDRGAAIAAGPGGEVVFAGTTQSPDFPTTPGAFDETPSPGGTFESRDAFVVRLSPDGTQVRYATVLGGTRTEWVDALVLDSAGRAHVGGATESRDLPVTTGGAGLAQSDAPDGFVARLSADGGALEMSRFVAGNTADWVLGLALGAAGDVYVAGSTNSDVFPVKNALRGSKFEPGSGDADHGYDGFAMRLSPVGEIRFSTYLGGMREDSVSGVGLGPDGTTYLAGSTSSDAFTGIAGARPNANTFTSDAFIVRLAADGSRVLNGRYYGGASDDWIADFVVDRFGVLGATGASGNDLFLAQFMKDLEFHRAETFGGSGTDSVQALAVDARGDSWVVGWTSSTDYPTVNAIQASWKGPQSFHSDGFVTKFACEVSDAGDTPHRTVGPEGSTGTITVAMDPGCALNPRPTANWIHITGIDANKIHYRVDPNSGSVSREAWIMVEEDWGTRITQRAAGTPPPGSTSEIVLNGEDVSLVKGSWTFDTDENDLHFIVRQRDAGRPKIAPALVSPEHYFEMTFHAEAGRPYRLWVLGRADRQHWANDSVHVQFSGSVDASGRTIYRIGSTSSADVNLEDCSGCGVPFGWSWEDNGWGTPGALGPEIRFASTGKQTLRVQTREDGLSVGQIVLSAERFLRSAPPEGQWVTSPGAVGTEQVRFARDASRVNGAWRFVADTTAANGERLSHPDAGAPKLNAPLATPSNFVEFTVQVEAQRPYRLWMRLKADRNYWGNDSVWVQFTNSIDASGSPMARIGSTRGLSVNLEECSGCGLDGWGWRDDGWGSSPAPLGTTIIFATPGPQTIRVQTREDGVSFDHVLLSADHYMHGPPGPAKRDNTLFTP